MGPVGLIAARPTDQYRGARPEVEPTERQARISGQLMNQAGAVVLDHHHYGPLVDRRIGACVPVFGLAETVDEAVLTPDAVPELAGRNTGAPPLRSPGMVEGQQRRCRRDHPVVVVWRMSLVAMRIVTRREAPAVWTVAFEARGLRTQCSWSIQRLSDVVVPVAGVAVSQAARVESQKRRPDYIGLADLLQSPANPECRGPVPCRHRASDRKR